MHGSSSSNALERVLSTSVLLALSLAAVTIVLALHQWRVRRNLTRTEMLNELLKQQLSTAAVQMSDLGQMMNQLRQQLECAETTRLDESFCTTWDAALHDAEEELGKWTSQAPPLTLGDEAVLTQEDRHRLRRLAQQLAAARVRLRELRVKTAGAEAAAQKRDMIRVFSALLQRLADERANLVRRILVGLGCDAKNATAGAAVIRSVYETPPGKEAAGIALPSETAKEQSGRGGVGP